MPGKPSAPPRTAAPLAALVLVLASCADIGTGPSARQDTPAAGAGSASGAGLARPDHTPASAPPPSPTGCRYPTAPIAARAGSQPAPVCLTPGADLTVAAAQSPAQPWQPMTSSDPSVLSCTSQPQADGALTATCRARAAGTATVSATTAAFAGDPHGPTQYTWTLTVHVLEP